jgi:Flp pilus assembly pilin Flp
MRNDRGSSTVEYALLVVLLALTCLMVIGELGGQSGSILDDSRSALTGS